MRDDRRTVGLLVDQIASLVDQDFFQNIIISGVADILRRKNTNLIVFVVGKLRSPHGWESSRNILLEFVNSGRLDGLIVLSTSIAGYADKETVGDLLRNLRNIPIVSIGEIYDSIPSVVSDGYKAMREMVDHLIEVHGKRKFAFIKGPEGGHESEVRHAAWRDSLAAHGIPYEKSRVFTGNYLYDSGQAAVRHFHECGIEYDALVASNDNMALGAISELKRIYGYWPPNLSIVGFDDAVFARPLGLTTVRQDFFRQAQVAADILCRLMDGENTHIRHELADQLVVRASCGCVPSVIENAFRRAEALRGSPSGDGPGRLSGNAGNGVPSDFARPMAAALASETPGPATAASFPPGASLGQTSGRPSGGDDPREAERLKRSILREAVLREIAGRFPDAGGEAGEFGAHCGDGDGDAENAAILGEMREQMAGTLVDGILHGENLPFYQAMDRYLHFLRDTGRPLTGLHDWLSRLRETALGLLPNPEYISFAEDLFHAARVHISDAIGKFEALRYFLSSLQTAQLEQFSEELVSALHFREQMKKTEELLAKYGIRYAFVALYEDPDRPLDRSRLILAIQNGEWVELGEGMVFPTLDFLPEPVFKTLKSRRLDLVVQVLYHGDTRLGYTVFSFDDRVTRYYDVINNRLSIALKNARHIMEEKNYSQKLEQQVAERTKELREANARLLEEIARRQEAEEKLRKALADLAALNAELRAISIRDELTGLLNRRGFLEQSKTGMRRFVEHGQACLVMFADMDNLKSINDRYGHGEGDHAIIQTANLLRSVLPQESILARLGGDEFTAVIPVPPDCREAMADIEERIAAAFAAFNRSRGNDYELSVSLGFACCGKDCAETFEELLILADTRLYEQKKAKRLR